MLSSINFWPILYHCVFFSKWYWEYCFPLSYWFWLAMRFNFPDITHPIHYLWRHPMRTSEQRHIRRWLSDSPKVVHTLTYIWSQQILRIRFKHQEEKIYVYTPNPKGYREKCTGRPRRRRVSWLRKCFNVTTTELFRIAANKVKITMLKRIGITIRSRRYLFYIILVPFLLFFSWLNVSWNKFFFKL